MSEVKRYTPIHSERFKEKEKCMSQFKNIEKLSLNIWDYKDPHHHFAVDAEELEVIHSEKKVEESSCKDA